MIRTDNTGEWKSAKVELYKDNIVKWIQYAYFLFKRKCRSP